MLLPASTTDRPTAVVEKHRREAETRTPTQSRAPSLIHHIFDIIRCSQLPGVPSQCFCSSFPHFNLPINNTNMFSTAARRLVVQSSSSSASRFYSSTSAMGKKVAVLGAAGGIGQPLSLLLKLSPQVTELSCYDIVGTPGVAADLSHIPSYSSVTGNLPAAGTWPPSHDTGIEAALTGASVVVIPAGVPRKPGMTRDDLFNTNAGTCRMVIIQSSSLSATICCACQPDRPK
jgi:hypothetical protein